MKKFIVNSSVMSSGMDPMSCALGTYKMLAKEKITAVKVDACYCCGPEGKVVAVFKAPTKEDLSKALEKVKFPVESIMEVEEVKPKK